MHRALFLLPLLVTPLPAGEDGDGSVAITGELKAWHAVTLTVDGPWAEENGQSRNPFECWELDVTYTHESGEPSYRVPGYFAADGNAAETSAEAGTKWRAHLSPDKPGRWDWKVDLHAMSPAGRSPAPGHGASGSFEVSPSDKAVPDFRARGRLCYVGERYLRFAGDGTRFLKAGPDAPETLLACADFDGTRTNNPKKGPLKTWEPHLRDWEEGDPTWQGGKGKGLVGALNYLSGKGMNTVSFLTYNAGGDGDNVWPFVAREEKFRYDCSRLDQWGIVFAHAQAKGLHLHFKLQETEMDDNRRGLGHKAENNTDVPTSLDGGKLGPERKLYLRELVARYAHHLALNWNIGEENTQSPEEVREMAACIRELDPYDHPIVIHTYPTQQEKVYPPLLGDRSELTGASLQNPWNEVHKRTLRWIEASAEAGKQWVVANDEQNPAGLGVPPDPGYRGFDGWARDEDKEGKKKGEPYNLNDIRRETLWGNLMAGGAGVEYYFGYRLPENDLACEDFRSRDRSWDHCRHALEFFQENDVPFWEMAPSDDLVGNPGGDSGQPWCLARPGECYVVFIPAAVEQVNLAWKQESKVFEAYRFYPDTGVWPEDGEAFTTTISGNLPQVPLRNRDKRDTVYLLRPTSS